MRATLKYVRAVQWEGLCGSRRQILVHQVVIKERLHLVWEAKLTLGDIQSCDKLP